MSEPVDIGTFVAVRGNPFTLPILRELDADGNGVELSSYGDTWTAKARAASTQIAGVTFDIDANNADGSADGSADAYRIVLSLPPEITVDMDGTYSCDLKATGGMVSPLTLYRWKLEVEDSVT